MGTFKKIIKDLLPPVVVKLYKNRVFQYGLFGNYLSWDEAKKHATGYDSEIILEKVKNSLLKVKTGAAVHERDSVLFQKTEYSWPLLAGLLKASANGGELRVLDFGGSLGTTYFQNRIFLRDLKKVQWSIVEQKNFVAVGKRFFEDQQLKFYDNLDICVRETNPNVIILSSSIQYIEEPYKLLERLLNFGAEYLIVDRTPLISEKSRIVIQKVNPIIYNASYPSWLLNESELVSFLQQRYSLLVDFDAIDGVWFCGNVTVRHRGYIFKKI